MTQHWALIPLINSLILAVNPQVLKYFCETCDEAICRDCAIYEHREHIYVDLKEAVKKYRSSITALQDRTKRKIPVLRAAVEEVREVTQDLRERVEVVRTTIRDTIQTHIRALEEQERELIGQLENISNSKEKVGWVIWISVSVLICLHVGRFSNWQSHRC